MLLKKGGGRDDEVLRLPGRGRATGVAIATPRPLQRSLGPQPLVALWTTACAAVPEAAGAHLASLASLGPRYAWCPATAMPSERCLESEPLAPQSRLPPFFNSLLVFPREHSALGLEESSGPFARNGHVRLPSAL